MRAAGSRRKLAKADAGAAPVAAKPARAGRKSAPDAKFDLVDMLGAAGWQEADLTLAASLRDLGLLEHAFRALAAKIRGGDLEPAARGVEDALLLVRQSLSYAGRKRGLQRFGQVGAVEPFDPQRHELVAGRARAPAQVRIKMQGVARGAGPHADILVKAEVSAVRPRKSRAPTANTARPRA